MNREKTQKLKIISHHKNPIKMDLVRSWVSCYEKEPFFVTFVTKNENEEREHQVRISGLNYEDGSGQKVNFTGFSHEGDSVAGYYNCADTTGYLTTK